MTRKKGYVLVQATMMFLCVLCALFIILNERIMVRHVRRNYELPFLGSTALLILDEYRITGRPYDIRAFEEANNIQVYYVTAADEVLYPGSLSTVEKQLVDHVRARLVLQGYGNVYEQDEKTGEIIWGVSDRAENSFAFIVQKQTGLRREPHPETRAPALFFAFLFCSFVVVVFVLIRRIFKGFDRTLEKTRDRMMRIQAVLDAQVRLLGSARRLMNRCGVEIRDRDPDDMVADELLARSQYLENSHKILKDSLLTEGEKHFSDRVSIYALCTQVQSMVADELAEAGIVIRLNEIHPGLYIRGQESLLMMALEDLFVRFIPVLPGGGVITAVISGVDSLVYLDITVPVGEKSYQPAGIFLSVFLFELMGITLRYQTNERGELIIHAEFQDSGV